MVTLSCAELPVREINRRLRATPPPVDLHVIGATTDGKLWHTIRFAEAEAGLLPGRGVQLGSP